MPFGKLLPAIGSRGAGALGRYGFTVLDQVIPPAQVAAVREEEVAAESIIERNLAAIRELQEGRTAGAGSKVELRPVRRVGHPSKRPNDLVWMPRYAEYLAAPVVTAVARRALDDPYSASPSSTCGLSTPTGPTAPPADSAMPDAAGAASASGIRTGPTI